MESPIETENQQSLMLEILIPGHKCGLMIGKGGETIRKLEENSGTQIQIIQKSRAPGDQAKPLQILGMPENIGIAKHMIDQLLESVEDRMPKGPATRANQVQMSQVRGIARIIVPRSAVGLIIGRGGEMIKRISDESGARIQFEQIDGSNPLESVAILNGFESQVARAAKVIRELVNRSNPEAQKPSITMLVPVSKTGLVIGKGGEVIKKINRETGAHVGLSRDPPIDGVHNLFVIKGNPHQIQSAQQAILAQINDKEGDISIQGGYQQGVQSQWGPISGYGQGQQESYQNWTFMQPVTYDQSLFGSSQPLPTQQQYSGYQQNYGGQFQQSVTPTTDQTDYSTQWIDYYCLLGMHDKADGVERLRASWNGQ